MDRRTASPGERIVAGLFAAGLGIVMLLVGAGVVPVDPRSVHGPWWMIVVVGLMFTGIGGSIVAGAASRTVDDGGEFTTTAPWWTRFFYYLIWLFAGAGLAAMASWVAFGPGSRTFGAVGPFLATRDAGEMLGRVVFGIGATLTWIVLIALAIHGGRKLFGRGRP